MRTCLLLFALTVITACPTHATDANPPEGTPPPVPPNATVPPKHRPLGWNDKRRTVRSYASNLGYNTVHVFSPTNVAPVLVTAGAAGVSTAFDDNVVRYFEQHPATTFGDVGAVLGGSAAVVGIVGLFSAGRIAPGDRFRSCTYDASQSMLINTAYTFAIKAAAHRERPDGSNNQSFPSGHASLAFSWASVVGHYYGPAVSIPAYSLATLIAVSRLPAHKHYLSDVVAGAGLGFTMGRTVVRGNSRSASGPPAEPILPKPHVLLTPDFGPDGAGAGARVVFRF